MLLAAFTLNDSGRAFSNKERLPIVIRDQKGLRLCEASAPSIDPTINTTAAASQAFFKPVE
jgi:hypothetical protein